MRSTKALLLSLSLTACGPSNSTDAGVDAPQDAAPDVTPDVAQDVAPDTTPDGAPDAAPDAAPDVGRDVEPFCDVPGTYTYGPDGGFAAYSESVRLEPGRRFTYTRTTRGLDGGVRTCATTLDYCGTADGGVHDTLAVINAFNDADVMAAFADQARTLYGRDTRPVDGQVFAVTRGDGRRFELGADCGAMAGCRPIPTGLVRLRAVLTELQTQQLQRPECAGVRP